jgi:hypothetical protein
VRRRISTSSALSSRSGHQCWHIEMRTSHYRPGLVSACFTKTVRFDFPLQFTNSSSFDRLTVNLRRLRLIRWTKTAMKRATHTHKVNPTNLDHPPMPAVLAIPAMHVLRVRLKRLDHSRTTVFRPSSDHLKELECPAKCANTIFFVS